VVPRAGPRRALSARVEREHVLGVMEASRRCAPNARPPGRAVPRLVEPPSVTPVFALRAEVLLDERLERRRTASDGGGAPISAAGAFR